MSVATILRRKGTHVDIASPDTTLATAASTMVARETGSLVILDRGTDHLLGVLTERDLVRNMVEHGAAALEMAASAVLRSRPTTCGLDDSLRKAMSLMTERRVRHLPVMADNTMVGIVSIGDIVKFRLEEIELEVRVLRDYARARA